MNVADFNEAIDLIAENKGIARQAVINALHDALKTAYTRYLHGGDDAKVEVKIDTEEGHVTIAQLKTIVDEVEDDYLQISKEDALLDAEETIDRLKEDIGYYTKRTDASKKKDLKYLLELTQEEKKNIKVGNEYHMYCDFETMSKLTAASFKRVLTQKIAEAGHEVLYELYKDHIGELVTGTVEQVNNSSITVNIGKGTTDLYKEDLIGDEDFRPGDYIKLYIEEAKPGKDANGKERGPAIRATRSSEGFLKRLFEEEIHEIYDGTVIIKGIARKAGIRSKVAVASNNEDVDPIGACIGPGGSRIQKIVSQLGNSKFKEKIDIIPYNDYAPLYIAESLRPTEVLGVHIVDENAEPKPTCFVVVEDEAYANALGKKGSNASLANRLTGWNIRIYSKSEVEDLGLEYTSFEELTKEAEEAKKAKERADYLKKSAEEALARAEANEKAIKAEPLPAIEEEESIDDDFMPEIKPIVKEEPVVVEEPKKPVEAPLATTSVKTTKTLEDLEKELSESKSKEPSRSNAWDKKKGGKSKRPHQISENEVAHAPAPSVDPSIVPASAMPIYSEEELAEIEAEENLENESFDEDYDQDDYEDYYDEDK